MNTEAEYSESKKSEILVNRILSGDRSAETEMVRNYQAKLFKTIQRYSWDIDLTNEIVQETWAITLEKVRGSQLKNKQSLGAFISRVGVNQLTMYYRKVKKFNYDCTRDIQELRGEASIADVCFEHASLLEIIQNVLSRMKISRDRELINDFYLEGEPKQNLCEQYQLSSAHFDRVLYRARNRFKKEWRVYSG